jgi:hypothetical protein
MSQQIWNMYCGNLLSDGKMEGCLIAGFDGNVWGQHMLYSSPGELKPLLNGFSMEGCQRLREQGIKLMGNRYWLSSCDEQVIRGVRGKFGFTAYKTNNTVVIGTWDSKVSHGLASHRVETMGSYIKSQGN